MIVYGQQHNDINNQQENKTNGKNLDSKNSDIHLVAKNDNYPFSFFFSFFFFFFFFFFVQNCYI